MSYLDPKTLLFLAAIAGLGVVFVRHMEHRAIALGACAMLLAVGLGAYVVQS